jgi:hypothetical protein
MMIAMIVHSKGDLGIRLIAYAIVFGTPISYFLRHTKPFDSIWRVLLSFWIALGLVLTYRNVKDRFNKK